MWKSLERIQTNKGCVGEKMSSLLLQVGERAQLALGNIAPWYAGKGRKVAEGGWEEIGAVLCNSGNTIDTIEGKLTLREIMQITDEIADRHDKTGEGIQCRIVVTRKGALDKWKHTGPGK